MSTGRRFTAGSMPGTTGFTIACFEAKDVPVGTVIYTEAEVMGLVGELNLLIMGYVRALDFARDRIISLGGSCDPIEVMEIQDPNLRRAREALSKFRGES